MQDPKSHHQLVALFILLSSIYYFPAASLCKSDATDSCEQPFDCGNIPNINYPFWNKDNSTQAKCSHPSFALICGSRSSSPILNISGLSFQVLSIDHSSYTLMVARKDLSNDPCHPVFVDTIIQSEHFEIPTDFNAKNLTLFYSCSQLRSLRNLFACSTTTTTVLNVFKIGNFNPADKLPCKQHIAIPVNESAALVLETVVVDAFKIREALAVGFPIRWFADNKTCTTCSKSGVKSDPPGVSPAHPLRVANQKRIKLGLVMGAIGLILALIILLSWCFKVRYFPRVPANPNVEKFLQEQGSLAPKRYRYSDIKKMTKSFNDKLGQGGYGSVYKGILPSGCPVAVKVLIEVDSDDEEFINEVASISRTSHINIVSLLGFCYERNKRALVYEFMPNKSLDKFIRNTDTSLDMETLYNIAIGVAKGLEYLHRGCTTRIIHFDIKPQNILLDEGFNPKISDFGLAKLCKKRTSILSTLGTRGTVGYIAPEVFSRNFGGVSHKSDVYSYGMMTLEMAGARNFLPSETVQSSENCFPDKMYEQAIISPETEIVDGNEHPTVELKDERARKMLLVGLWCIQTMPSDRPSISKVVEMLEGNLDLIKIPPKPFLFNPGRLGKEFSPSSMSLQFDIEDSTEYQSATKSTTFTSSSKEEASSSSTKPSWT